MIKDLIKYLGIILIFTFLILNVIINLNYREKVLPNIYISGINVGGLTTSEALERLKILSPKNKNITLVSQTKKYMFNSNYFKFDFDAKGAVLEAYRVGRSKNEIENLKNKFTLFFSLYEIDYQYNFDKELIDLEISRIVGEEKVSGNDAHYIYQERLTLIPEKEGISVNYGKLTNLLNQKLSKENDVVIEIPYYKRNPEITSIDLISIQKDIEEKFLRSFELKFFEKKRVLTPKEIFTFLKIRKNKDGIYYDLNEDLLKKLTFELRNIVDNKPRASVSKYEGDQVLEFNINQEGSVLDEVSFRKDFRKKLFAGEYFLNLPSIKIGNNFTKESYGITHVLGVGTSKFSGSINSRVHNLALAAEKINGTLVGPGEEFSFLKTVGSISSFSGFQTAYIISQGRTVLGEGGGVCQTSTTLFRAMLNAGLPVTARYPHAYRVGYYEQDAKPGLDASVYYPSLDLKFRNDTNRYILIQSEVDKKNYTMKFYLFGSKDGREVEITEPELFGYRSAPPAEYIEDASLKPGEVKQVDFSASGITSSFSRVVKRNGEELYNDNFTTTYSPWKAIFLKGPEKKR
jgi:vancomycin resistance protein YoaR